MPEIRISAVCRDFGQHRALDEVDLTIESGSLTALVGPTGCGKTTLLELIGGLQNPSRGRITVDGEDVVGPRRDTILIFQQHNLFDWLTVRDNVAFGLRNRGLSKREARRRANEQLEHVGLAAFVDRVPGELLARPLGRGNELEVLAAVLLVGLAEERGIKPITRMGMPVLDLVLHAHSCLPQGCC